MDSSLTYISRMLGRLKRIRGFAGVCWSGPCPRSNWLIDLLVGKAHCGLGPLLQFSKRSRKALNCLGFDFGDHSAGYVPAGAAIAGKTAGWVEHRFSADHKILRRALGT